MNELILIEGVEQRRLEQVMRRVAGKELDREGSITELRLVAVFSVNKWCASSEAVYGRGGGDRTRRKPWGEQLPY